MNTLMYFLFHAIVLTLTLLGARGHEWAPNVNGFFLWFIAIAACQGSAVNERGKIQEDEYQEAKHAPWTIDFDIIFYAAYAIFYIMLGWVWTTAASVLTLLATIKFKKLFNERAARDHHSAKFNPLGPNPPPPPPKPPPPPPPTPPNHPGPNSP